MTPARFRYTRPESLDEALAVLAVEGEAATPLAGGQSLMPMMALRVARPELVLDLNRIPGLGEISLQDGRLRIGAMARHAALLADPLVARVAPLLPMALTHVAHPAIRNRGTLGGSLSLADPAAEMPACMIALEAAVLLASAGGVRRVAAEDFFTGLYATVRRADELLTGVEIPDRPGWTPWFAEVARRHGDYAMAGLALMRGPGVARLSFFGLEAAPRRLPTLEAALAAGGDAAAGLDELVTPLHSPEAPAAYRLHLARQLLARAAMSERAHASA